MPLFSYEPVDRTRHEKVRVVSLVCPVEVCGQVFPNLSQDDNTQVRVALMNHMSERHQIFDLMCYRQECNPPAITRDRMRSFAHQQEFNRHEDAHFNADVNKNIAEPNQHGCPLCAYRGICRTSVSIHFRWTHVPGKFTCKYCDFTATKQIDILEHQKPPRK